MYSLLPQHIQPLEVVTIAGNMAVHGLLPTSISPAVDWANCSNRPVHDNTTLPWPPYYITSMRRGVWCLRNGVSGDCSSATLQKCGTASKTG